MNEESIRNMFLRIITEYDYLGDDFTEQDLADEFSEILSMAVMELQMQGLMLDIDYDSTSGFVPYDPSGREGYILAYASVLIWLTPKVNSAEMLAAQLTSTDFTQFSNANRLNACMKLYAQCEAKLNNLIADFDKLVELVTLREEV